MENNTKGMDYGVKEGENGWKMVTFQQVDMRMELRDLSILNYSYMHLGFRNNYWN